MPPKKAAAGDASKGKENKQAAKAPANNNAEPSDAQAAKPVVAAPKPPASSSAKHDSEVTSKPTTRGDPVEAGIQKRLDEIEVELSKCRSGLDSVRTDSDSKRGTREELFDKQRGLREKLNEAERRRAEVHAQKQALFDQKKDLRHHFDVKITESKNLKKALTGNFEDAAKDVEAYSKKIDEEIRKLESKQSSAAITLAAEKQIIADIAKLQNSKKSFKGYKDLNDAITKDKEAINAIEAKIKEIDVVFDAVINEKKEIRAQLDGISGKIDDIKSNGDQQRQKSEDFRDTIKRLQDERNEQRQALRDHKNKKFVEEKEKRNAHRQAERERDQAYQQEKRKKDLEREAEELKQEPYSEEVDIIDLLIKFLEPHANRLRKQEAAKQAEKEAAKAAKEGKTEEAEASKKEEPKPKVAEAPGGRALNMPEGTVLVRDQDEKKPQKPQEKRAKKAPKPKNVELKLNVSLLTQFEKVSVAPPSNAADCDGTLQELRKRKAEFKDRAKKSHQERLAKFNEKVKHTHKEQKEESSGGAGDVLEGVNTTTTTTSTTTDEKAEEAPAAAAASTNDADEE